MKALSTAQAPAAIGPYSQAIVANGLIFVSGQLPADPVTGVLETMPAAAASQALRNLSAILAEGGASLQDCVKVTIYLTDMAFFAEVNTVYATFFKEPYPARVTVAVAALPKGAVLEIDCVACLKERRS